MCLIHFNTFQAYFDGFWCLLYIYLLCIPYTYIYIPTILLPDCTSSKVDGGWIYPLLLHSPSPWCKIHHLPVPEVPEASLSRLEPTGSVPHYSLVAVSRRSQPKWIGWHTANSISMIGVLRSVEWRGESACQKLGSVFSEGSRTARTGSQRRDKSLGRLPCRLESKLGDSRFWVYCGPLWKHRFGLWKLALESAGIHTQRGSMDAGMVSCKKMPPFLDLLVGATRRDIYLIKPETQERRHCGKMTIFVEMAQKRRLQQGFCQKHARQLLVVSSPRPRWFQLSPSSGRRAPRGACFWGLKNKHFWLRGCGPSL